MSKYKVYSTDVLVEVYDDDHHVIVSVVTPGYGAKCGDCDWEFYEEKWKTVTTNLGFHWHVEHDWPDFDNLVSCKTL